MNRSLALQFLPFVLALCFATFARGEIVIFQFSGAMSSRPFDFGVDFAPGDILRGSYTFDTSAPGEPFLSPIGDPEGTIATQFASSVVAWELEFPTQGYRFTGTTGTIAVGNDTNWGDRYIVTLNLPMSVGTPLPSGRNLTNFIQIDLEDRREMGADFLNDGSIQSTPFDLALVDTAAGRFDFVNNDQPFFDVFMLTAVPEPSTLALAALGTVGLLIATRLKAALRSSSY